MKKIDRKYFLLVALTLVALIFYSFKPGRHEPLYSEIKPEYLSFVKKISASGLVTPQNRVIVTAPINGRIDKVLIEDGQVVKKKQVLAWMSSQDRAALMDAVQVSNEKENPELSQMYKPTPIVAQEGGLIIAKTISKGQNVSVETSLFEISDRLVFVAKVDETDLGKIAINQKVRVRVDAFPEKTIEAKVLHIVHQSTLSNNVTTYDVFVEPTETVPENLRSGMSISVDFILLEKQKALLVPSYVTEGQKNFSISLKVKTSKQEIQVRNVKIGETNGEYSEVLEGLTDGDTVLFQDLSILTNETSKSGMGIFGKRNLK